MGVGREECHLETIDLPSLSGILSLEKLGKLDTHTHTHPPKTSLFMDFLYFLPSLCHSSFLILQQITVARVLPMCQALFQAPDKSFHLYPIISLRA
jgi:hypothetical protein